MPTEKIIFSHPTGNANVRAALAGLQEAGLLGSFYTSIAAFPGNIYDRLGRIPQLAEFKKRSFDPRLAPLTRTLAFKELSRIASSKSGFKNLIKHEKGMFSIDAVYQSIDRHVASKIQRMGSGTASAIYAYEDGASYSFNAAKTVGIKCLYDLPIGYWRAARKLLSEERERRPEWAATLTGFMDSEAKLARKDEELRLADHIFVASSFTASTLGEYPGDLAPVSIVPYGFPEVIPGKTYNNDPSKPLRLLFVGGLSQRKGIANVFDAMEHFKGHVELTVVGHKTSDNCPALDQGLKSHRWIPSLPHAEILKLMRAHDVLIFPSLFEGFGLVITEAMSQGTPVITTDRTAGPDLIVDGENGWLIDAGSTLAIQEVLDKLLADRSLVEANGLAALQTASLRPWSAYGTELSERVRAAIR